VENYDASKPELAYFAIADISGYTSFLAGVELDHAQDIIADFHGHGGQGPQADLPTCQVLRAMPAFVYAVAEKVDQLDPAGYDRVGLIQVRRRLRDVKQASICECKACVAMSDLDFKFVVHHGEMVKQKMGGREELAGRDVIRVPAPHGSMPDGLGAAVAVKRIRRGLPTFLAHRVLEEL